ncbi:arginine--tRNA ligase [Flavobacterium columnare]|uniref:Arginine--tRNA ligase n=1 Tax=Flavobacterium columnare (strain ATCC 49512 / CIP 103533 / TG 44/87) TaxID=1041826 RepID=G8XA90_FLACA|nr:arginine--tRNA ligase [Flavobacterium columnare]AEW85948.1 arginyl-tRNA synthetase [Flavobacterium columnare ATCC 49512]ANO47972.1 arginyl-tRNA ligase [Flavobacterium columnare]APT21447.1 arginine--tRNA ligase [Flavobacterium columnare]MBF6653748.1 arginine--tRNA ligase [Flavobacterium columnare]MBF6654732.1 arginine--tRNA ligase [Flavobacterium columnare]
MTLQQILTEKIKIAVEQLFEVSLDKVEFQATRREFEGDITMVVFPLLKLIKGNPVEIGSKIGDYLVQNVAEIEKFNVVQGFLNLVVADRYYVDFFNAARTIEQFGFKAPIEGDKAVMVEYSSPNTNKPLHLGHIRNNLLGHAVAEIVKASGKKVYKTQIINDRGIHICKSMLAWQKEGKNQTPESTGLKGDKLVGHFYVEFDKQYKNEIKELIAAGHTEEEAKKIAPSILEAQEMLRKWEAGDAEVVALWKKMNQWVYDGFSVTYKNLGVDFDSYYYESNTYLLGKDVIEEGLQKGVFYKKEDGSVWIDLTSEGLDEKLVLRADGTSVYITQDIGTAIQRVKDTPDVGGMVYTVGNEQDYHFKVLFLILKKLGFDWAEQLYHLSYGMVELPSGKMKSREGTVVDADDLMAEMTSTAQSISEELGKLDGYTDQEKADLYKIIGLGALKYYMLKVDPKKTMMFNPEESVDFNGNTGPFIQYTYARIQSILRKADFDCSENILLKELHEKEKELIKQIALFPEAIQNAAVNHSPALVANYTYDLVKEFNSFYQNVSILGEENTDKKIFRVQLAKLVGETIQRAFSLLGIQVPERM